MNALATVGGVVYLSNGQSVVDVSYMLDGLDDSDIAKLTPEEIVRGHASVADMYGGKDGEGEMVSEDDIQQAINALTKIIADR